MNLEEHDSENYGTGMKVWLSNDEIADLLAAAEDTEQRIAFALGARCGLRSAEWLDVEPRHVVDTAAGKMLRVWDGKGEGGKYRETPIPSEIASMIETAGDMGNGHDSPVIRSASSPRTLRKWLGRARDRLAEEHNDQGWQYLSTHDLRRTWAGQLRASRVDAPVVLNWGGWEDMDTFLDHYRGEDTPEAQKRERGKVDWL